MVVKSATPAIAIGVVDRARADPPSCPRSFAPQQYARARTSMRHVCIPPVTMDVRSSAVAGTEVAAVSITGEAVPGVALVCAADDGVDGAFDVFIVFACASARDGTDCVTSGRVAAVSPLDFTMLVSKRRDAGVAAGAIATSPVFVANGLAGVGGAGLSKL